MIKRPYFQLAIQLKYAILLIGIAIILSIIGLGSDSDLNFSITGDEKNELRFFDVVRVIFLISLTVFFFWKDQNCIGQANTP